VLETSHKGNWISNTTLLTVADRYSVTQAIASGQPSATDATGLGLPVPKEK
jgi:hypothetical protein